MKRRSTSSVCVIDTSAVVALRFREPEAEAIAVRLGASPFRIIPPSCIVEFCMLHRYGSGLREWISDFIVEYEVGILPTNDEIAWIAAEAAEQYGRGSQHPARLNFGDCISYAYARHLDAPLLFKGDDFVHTDITSALPVSS